MSKSADMYRAILGEYLVELPKGETIEEIRESARNILLCEPWWEDLTRDNLFAVADGMLNSIVNHLDEGILLFEKEYVNENLAYIQKDICEAFDPRFNPTVRDVDAKYPMNEVGFRRATYRITIEVI